MSCPDCSSQLIPIHHGKVDMNEIYQVINREIHIGYRYSLENHFCKNCKIALRDTEVVE